MTKLLEQAIATVRGLSDGDQDRAAQFLLGFANPEADHYQLSPEQLAEVELAKDEARAGKFATDAEMDESGADSAAEIALCRARARLQLLAIEEYLQDRSPGAVRGSARKFAKPWNCCGFSRTPEGLAARNRLANGS